MHSLNISNKDVEKSLQDYKEQNYLSAYDNIQEVLSSAVKNKDKELIALCLALKSLYSYYKKELPYKSIMSELDSANFLAETLNNQELNDIINIVHAQILYDEKDYHLAEKYIKTIKNPDFKYLNYADLKKNILSKVSTYPEDTSNPMVALLNIAKTISSNTNIDSLLKTIADETTSALNAERCSVFLLDKQTKELWSKVATGIDFEEIRFPMDKGLAGHVAMTGDTINIKDVYSDNRFNNKIDKQTGYHTRNLLCMPIRNMHYEIIGVLQVLNKIGGYFSEDDENMLVTIGMNAGITIENSRLFEKQKQMLEQQKELFNSFVDTLVASIDARDKITSGHSSRVKLYAKLICESMNIDNELADLIEQAAILHDIGKIGIKDSVLQKEGKLTNEEYSHIQEHAKITHDILSKIYNTKDTEQIAKIASSHHEKYNGKGYYQGLKETEIPLGGRILAVADVFDAITSKRHYREKMPIKNVINILINDSGTHFDPKITQYFLSITCDKILEVLLSENNKTILKKDKKNLSSNTLKDLNKILDIDEEKLDEKQKIILNTFNKYYQET